MNLVLLFLIIYLVVCLGIALIGYLKRRNTLEDFYLSRRQTGGFIAFMTFSATLFSSFTLVGMPGYFYTHGIGAWAFIIFADLLMAVLVYFLGTKLWEASRKWKLVTPTEYVTKRYNKTAGVIALIISFVFLLPYISTQIIGMGIILDGVLGLTPYVISGSLVLIIILYSELGGMRSISWTDALQGGILIIVGLILMFGLISHFGGVSSMFSQVDAIEPKLMDTPGPAGLFTFPMLFSFFTMILLMPVTQPQLSSRFFIPKSRKVLRTMLISVPIFALLAIIPTMFVGFGAKILNPGLATGDLALSTVLGIFPEAIAALAIVGVIAASMSTADSQVLALSSLVTRDLYKGRRPMYMARLSIVAIILLALLISFKPPTLIVTLSILSFAGTMQIAPAMLGGLFWKKGTTLAAICSMLSGVAVLILYQWFFIPPLGFHAGFWGLIVGTIVYIGLSLKN